MHREKRAQAAPPAVDDVGQRRQLRAPQAAPVRLRALVMLFIALVISESVALDVDDVGITARKGVLVVLGTVRRRRASAR